MGETTIEDTASAAAVGKSKPTTILVPPRGTMESIFTNGSAFGLSPGPMTLVSSFFSEQGPFSFSQLLAGAMTSPIIGSDNSDGFGVIEEEGVKDGDLCDNDAETKDGSSGGYKRNRPVNLVVAAAAQPRERLQVQLDSLSPLFMVPPGLSPSGLLNSPGFLSPLQSPFGMSHQQALAHVTAQAALSQSYMQMQAEYQRSSSSTPSITEPLAFHSPSPPPNEATMQQQNHLLTEQMNYKVEPSEVSQSDKKAASIAGDKPASDGYNWRKYGQKHVKASECPRSYYKCTFLNCPVKKKVERSIDGRISEIIYKGNHNHDIPQPNKRGKDSYALDKTINSQVKPVIAQTEINRSNESANVNPKNENLQFNAQESFENQTIVSYNGDGESTAIVVDDVDNDEPIAKRRNVDIGSSMAAASHVTVTESKIVVQTRSEVDLLDDGYKWRKYGQKVVKGNLHPRSYYRCTYAGCNVRKHVERASADPKSVITTYEGKHEHELPVGRYSSHGPANPNAQQLKTQKVTAKNASESREMDFGNNDQMPITLQLKEEQIAA